MEPRKKQSGAQVFDWPGVWRPLSRGADRPPSRRRGGEQLIARNGYKVSAPPSAHRPAGVFCCCCWHRRRRGSTDATEAICTLRGLRADRRCSIVRKRAFRGCQAVRARRDDVWLWNSARRARNARRQPHTGPLARPPHSQPSPSGGTAIYTRGVCARACRRSLERTLPWSTPDLGGLPASDCTCRASAGARVLPAAGRCTLAEVP